MRVVPTSSTLVLFALASAVLVAAPGPAVVYIVTRSIAQGRRAGILSALGVEVGALVHVTAGAVGGRLRRSAAARRVLDRLSGASFVGLGMVAALSRR